MWSQVSAVIKLLHGASVWLDTGRSFVTDNARSNPRMPFGGIKHSVCDRECPEGGIREFVNIQSVLIKE